MEGYTSYISKSQFEIAFEDGDKVQSVCGRYLGEVLKTELVDDGVLVYYIGLGGVQRVDYQHNLEWV